MRGWQEQAFEQHGARLTVLRNSRADERWEFSSEDEATARRRFIAEAFTWVGTPFRDCADVKGPNGAVDCAMLLVRCAAAAGLIDRAFDPRPYSPRWHVHRGEEKFIDFLMKLGAREVGEPRLGDVLVWQFGRCYGHGAILVNREEVVHSYGAAKMCIVSRLDEPTLNSVAIRGKDYPRPVRYFDIWSARRKL
jgi:cell wall-associated NlpC family hydrolase